MPFSRRLPLFLFAVTLTTLGCHAQTPAAGSTISPELAHRVEVLLRQKAQLPPGATIQITNTRPSELPGYNTISVTFSADGKSSKPVDFLLSTDGKTMAQFSKFDISADPRLLISPVGRPSRGGPDTAPVIIVGFDDLECPYCAELHKEIFPAITERYGDKVHIVYKDFPLDQHPWAMHAALDVNCLAAESPAGYWNMVDYIHAHSSEIGADPKDARAEKTVARATSQLDDLTREQAKFQKVDEAKVSACIAKNDTAAIVASTKLGMSLGVDSTPSLFINGAKIDGALPLEFLFARVDDALRAKGVEPPPPYVAPAVKAAPAGATTSAPATAAPAATAPASKGTK